MDDEKEFSVGRANIDTTEDYKKWNRPREIASMLLPVGTAVGATARGIPILAAGAREVAKQRAMAEALRAVRNPNTVEGLLSGIFAP